jgi:hypothetical protein
VLAPAVHGFEDLVEGAGQVTGISAALSCISSGKASTCLEAAAELGMTAVTIASLGEGAGVEAAVETAMDTAEEGGTAIAAEDAGLSGPGTRLFGDLDSQLSLAFLSRFGSQDAVRDLGEADVAAPQPTRL